MSANLTALKSTLSWAIPVPDRSEIPDTFKSEYDLHFKLDEAPYILYNPVQDHLRSLSNEKLICLAPDRLVILATNHSPFTCAFSDVIYFRQEEELLAYSLTILTQTDEVRVDYNAACADLFEPIVSRLRIRGESTKTGHTAWQRLSELARQDLKFTNYARQVLRDSGNLVEMVYQPELIVDNQTIVDTSLLLLTETELCWVCTERKEWIHEPVYGGVFSIAGRDAIVGHEIISPADNGPYQLIVTLLGNYHWRFPFTADRKDAIERLLLAL
jgi:hypothetical protein